MVHGVHQRFQYDWNLDYFKTFYGDQKYPVVECEDRPGRTREMSISRFVDILRNGDSDGRVWKIRVAITSIPYRGGAN